MTEQPAEPQTEQQWLQNDPLPLPEVQAHHYAPNAHRLPTQRLTPPARDNTPVVILFNKAAAAAAKLLQASEASKQAEDALSEALAVENLRAIDSDAADHELLEYVRKVAAQ